MKFGLRMLMVGLATVPAGIGWFVVSFTDSDWNEILTGGVWKGPLLAIAGAGVWSLESGR